MLLLAVASLKIFCSRDNSCMDDSLRRCGILFLSASDKLMAAAMNAYLGVMVDFFMYLCLNNTVSGALGACVCFTHSFQHR